MNLENQITQIANPQEFTRLCNTVLTEIYGTDFQPIDGTRGDGGNDGYVVSEERLIAMYCPIKPERKTDKDYLVKIRSDLKKAHVLHRSGKYIIKNWTFITPRKLSNDVISAMRSEGEKYGIIASHQESTYLANGLYKNKHLIPAFPDLHLLDLDSKFDEIIKHLPEESLKEAVQDTDIDHNNTYKPDTVNNDEFDRVVELRESIQTDQTKTELRSLFYKSTDPTVQVNAILGILEISNLYEDEGGELIKLCENGINITENLKNESLKAYFVAQKGYFISMIYAKLDFETASEKLIGNTLGILNAPQEQQQKTSIELKRLEKGFTQAFSNALNLVIPTNDFQTLASILILIGNAACQRAIHLSKFGFTDRAVVEKTIVKKTLLLAKNIYSKTNDELGVAYAIFNLANNIRCMGEKEEALELTKDVLEISRKLNDEKLLQKAAWLEESLKTGEIPDYLNGEERK